MCPALQEMLVAILFFDLDFSGQPDEVQIHLGSWQRINLQFQKACCEGDLLLAAWEARTQGLGGRALTQSGDFVTSGHALWSEFSVCPIFWLGYCFQRVLDPEKE